MVQFLAQKYSKQVWTKFGSGEHCSREMTRKTEEIMTLV